MMLKCGYAAGLWTIVLATALAGCQGEPGAFQKKWRELQAERQSKLDTMKTAYRAVKQLDDTASIVYVDMVDQKSQLFTMTPGGESIRQLTFDEGYKTRPTWSLDHQQIAYFHYHDDRPMGEVVSISVIQADGTNNRRVINDKKIDTRKIRISWHPKGHILYVQEMDFPAILFGYSCVDGTQVETVRLPRESFMTEAHTLSPDLNIIAGAGPSRKDGLWHIGTVYRDGSRDTDLMMPFKKIEFHLGTVVWSYRSDLIAFELDKIIMVLSSKIQLDFKAFPIYPQDLNAQLSQPAFSPSGKKLVAVIEKNEEGHRATGDSVVLTNLVVMNINGTKQVPVTTSGTCFDPHW